MACVASLLALHRRCIVPICASAVGDLIALVALAVYDSCLSLQEVKPSPYIRSAPKRASRIVAAACFRYTATPSARPVVPSKSPSSARENKKDALSSPEALARTCTRTAPYTAGKPKPRPVAYRLGMTMSELPQLVSGLESGFSACLAAAGCACAPFGRSERSRRMRALSSTST